MHVAVADSCVAAVIWIFIIFSTTLLCESSLILLIKDNDKRSFFFMNCSDHNHVKWGPLIPFKGLLEPSVQVLSDGAILRLNPKDNTNAFLLK